METSKLEQPGPAGVVGRAAPKRGSPGGGDARGPVLTPAEHQAYADELSRLREIRDRDLPGLLREARTFVASDAVEEMIQIREDQAVVGARIGRLEALLRTARVVEDDVAGQVVTLGRRVQLEYVRTGHVATYRVAGVPQRFGSETVSAASPIGAALMGRSAGDLVAVALPGGRVEDVRILSVLREEEAA